MATTAYPCPPPADAMRPYRGALLIGGSTWATCPRSWSRSRAPSARDGRQGGAGADSLEGGYGDDLLDAIGDFRGGPYRTGCALRRLDRSRMPPAGSQSNKPLMSLMSCVGAFSSRARPSSASSVRSPGCTSRPRRISARASAYW